MKKKIIEFLLLGFTLVLGAAEKIVPAGTYGNLLQNSKLEVLVNNFPTPWKNTEGRCTFVPESAPGGGGLFRIGPCKSIVVIRQDWTFTLTENLHYRLSAKVRTSSDYKAEDTVILVFNNGWTKTAPVPIKADSDTGWRTVSKVIMAPSSPGGHYSVGIVARKVKSGMLEVADITLEPASAEAQDAQTAWLKNVSLRKLHVFGIHKGILLAPTISGRWYGPKTETIEYAFDQQNFASVKINEKGEFTLPASKMKSGKHLLRIKINGKVSEYPFVCQDYPNRKLKVLNNLNVQIAELNAFAGQQQSFVMEQESPVLFRMKPETLTLTVDGGKKILKNGEWIRLNAGVHMVKASADGKIAVHRIADTVYYQLNNGPYLTGLPKNSLSFGRKNLMG